MEQHGWWRPGRAIAPGFVEQCRQLTAARAEFNWLRAGSQMVQQQALKDFSQAVAYFFNGSHRRPTWRKAGQHEGFRVVGRRGRQWDVRRVSRNVGEVRIPKVGWVRFRWSRQVSADAKSFRVVRDRAGRWHVSFAVVPPPIPSPGNGQTVGVDRGVAVSAALSTGELLRKPRLSEAERRRLHRLQRQLARAKPGSQRRARLKVAVAEVRAREVRRGKDWVEKVSTDLARRFDVIAIEQLDVRAMTRSARGTVERPGRGVAAKAGLNRSIRASGWGSLATRVQVKAPGRVVKVQAAYTSQRCSACGVVDAKSRKSQAVFACRSCGYACNADVNAAINIEQAAGHAVSAREGPRVAGPVHREPQVVAK